ncbi:hypothetical protein KY304_00235 [Candidatus Woesearchaeota archaeon]|nr:hypothetical protein [Candidatus Woesearchaeota archaeon]MBW2978523.1 hypothetical protein [Candidatus Woesearchaeota archaeon]
MKIEEKIKKKKWTRQEINKAVKILRSAKYTKTPLIKFFDTIVYWTSLLVAIIGNFAVSVVLVPLLIVLKGPALYFTLFFVGASFGTLIYTLIRIVESIDPKKNFIAGLFIVALAVINIYIITGLTNKLEMLMGITTNAQEPIIVSIVYSIGYIIPYLFFLIKEHTTKRQDLNTAVN